MLNRDGELLN